MLQLVFPVQFVANLQVTTLPTLTTSITPTDPNTTPQASDYSGHFDHPHHLYHFDHFCFALVVQANVYRSSSLVEQLCVWHRRLHTVHIA